MLFHTYGNKEKRSLLLIHGLEVSHEIFLPLIDLLKDDFYIVAVGIDGFLLGQTSQYTSVDDQAMQAARYVRENLDGHLDVAYGLSLGGKILSRILERNEIVIDHAIMDAAPLLPLPKWCVDPLRDGYKDVYTHKLESIHGADIHFWYGTKEAFVAKPQAKHLCEIHPDTHVEIFTGMNHGQLLVDHPEDVAKRILGMV